MTNIRFPSLEAVGGLLSQNATIAAYKKRFADWSTRNDLYADNTGYEKYNEWLYSSKLNQQVEKLTEALIALEELQRRKDSITNADEMEVVIKRIIHTELTKLEVVQLRKLQKIQRLERKDLNLANNELENAIKSLNAFVKDIEHMLKDESTVKVIKLEEITKRIDAIKQLIAKTNRPEILDEEFTELNKAIKKLSKIKELHGQRLGLLALDDHLNSLKVSLSIIKQSCKSMEDLIDVKSEDLDEGKSDVETLTKELKLKHKENKKAINGRKVSYSSEIKAIKDSQGQSVLRLIKFFERHEKKFRFSSKLEIAGHVSTVLDIPKQSVSLVERIAKELPTVLTIPKEIGDIFAAMPIVTLFIKGLTDVISLIKHLIQRKSSNKLLESSITGIATGSAFILGALVPVTAFFITIGFTAYGFVRASGYPFFSKVHEARKARKEVNTLQETMSTREDNIKRIENITLSRIEKHMLMRLIEKDLLVNGYDRNNTTVVTNLGNAKALINSKEPVSIYALASNTVLQKALKLDTSLTEKDKKRENFINCLHIANKNEIEQQEKRISKLKKSLLGMAFGSEGLGVVTLVGAALLCTPSPPTIIAGAAIILATAVIGVALKYGLPSMIMNFFKDKFGSDKKEEKKIEKSAEPGQEPRISVELSASSTNVAVQALNDKANANSHENKAVKDAENKKGEWKVVPEKINIGPTASGKNSSLKLWWVKRNNPEPVAASQEAHQNSPKIAKP